MKYLTRFTCPLCGARVFFVDPTCNIYCSNTHCYWVPSIKSQAIIRKAVAENAEERQPYKVYPNATS